MASGETPEKRESEDLGRASAPRVISISELEVLASGTDSDARFAQDLLTNVTNWRQMPAGPEKDEYARKQQTTARGMLGRTIRELDEKSVSENLEKQNELLVNSPAHSPQAQSNAVNSNIVETKAVFLETADLRALREEDLALGRKGGPAEQFLGLLDNFRKILKPGKEQEAAVRRVKRMAISLLSGRLQDLQSKKVAEGTDSSDGANDSSAASRVAQTSYSRTAAEQEADKQFILDLKTKMRGDSALQKIPAQFYERRQSLADWAKELEGHVAKLSELHKPVDVTERQDQAVGLNAALNKSGSGKKAILHAETEIRKSLAMMSEKDVKDLVSSDRYKTLVSDLLYSAHLSAATRQSATILLTPGWQRSPESVRQLVSIAIKDNSFELLKSTCRYCTADARHALQQTPEVQEARKVFSMYGKHLNEVIQYGRESLTTQLGTAEGFAHGWFGLANKDEIKKFVDKASMEDRTKYLLGEKLVGKTNLDTDEKEAVSFYKEVDAALRAATNPVINSKQYDLLRNKLVGGEEIYAALRELHRDEYFGLVRSNDIKGMRRAVELLSLKDWNSLRETPGRFRELDLRLRQFLNPQEHSEIIGMLRAKVGDKSKDNLTFEESQKRGRVPIEIALLGSDPEKWNIVWTTDNENQLEKLEMLLQMSQLEISSYLKDKGNPRYLDTLVSAQLTGNVKLIAERTLKHALLIGKMEIDEMSKALLSNLSKAPLKEQLKNFESILSRPGVMSRLRSPQDSETKALRTAMDSLIAHFVEEMHKVDMALGIGSSSAANYSKTIFEGATIPIEMKLLLRDDYALSVADLLKLTTAERESLTSSANSGGNSILQQKVFSDQKQLSFIRELFTSGRKDLNEVDKLRAAIVGFNEDKGQMILRLSSMSQSDIQKLSQSYTSAYGSSLAEDLFRTVAGRQRMQVRDIFEKEFSSADNAAALQRACERFNSFCKQSRELLRQFPDDEQEFFEELAFAYASAREIENFSSRSTFSKLTASVPLREAIEMLSCVFFSSEDMTEGLAAKKSGKSPRPGSKSNNSKLAVVRAIMVDDFDHSLFADFGGQANAKPGIFLVNQFIHNNIECMKLLEHASSDLDELRGKRFIQMVDVFQRRVNDFSVRVSFWQEVSRFFEGASSGKHFNNSISKSECLWLAEQVLCECAFPNNVKPGIGNDTNTLAIACNLLADNKPTSYVHLIASSVLEDCFLTCDGTIVKPSNFGAFTHDLDVIELKNRPCLADYSDLVGTAERPLRNFSGKIAQTVLANIYWQTHAASLPVLQDKSVVRLARSDEQNVQASLFTAGELSFHSTEFGHEMKLKVSGIDQTLYQFMDGAPNLIPSRNPSIDFDSLPDVYSQVLKPEHNKNEAHNSAKINLRGKSSEATRAL